MRKNKNTHKYDNKNKICDWNNYYNCKNLIKIILII